MGTKESKQQTNEDIPQINHPKFNNYKVINHNEVQLVEIQVGVASEKQFKSWESLLKKAPTNSDSLLLPIEYSFVKQGYCGSTGFVNIKYPNFPFLLQDQITNRQGLNHKNFQENQLWYLVFTLLSSAAEVHSKNQKVGDIKPDNVFISEDGQVKVANIYSWPSQQTNYSKTFFEKEVTYLAPEEMRDMQFGKMEPTADFQLAETFSIGLTILDAAILSSSKRLYQKNNKFDYQMLEASLLKLHQAGYSQVLEILIRNMCEAEATLRQNSVELFNWLKPYQDYIVGLEDFEITGIPEKLLATHVRLQSTLPPNSFPNSTKPPNSQLYSPERLENNAETVNASKKRSEEIQLMMPRDILQTYIQPQVKSPQVMVYVDTNKPYYSQPYYPVIKQPISEQYIPGSYVIANPTKVNIQSNQGGFNLQKIDEQLQMSRKMFPS